MSELVECKFHLDDPMRWICPWCKKPTSYIAYIEQRDITITYCLPCDLIVAIEWINDFLKGE